ncbi:MAG: hypothetical protein GY696_37155 [Gammaproteobacteria bacterium]|nr:hypothetical protein [Gammaproteobacteria bacterium]
MPPKKSKSKSTQKKRIPAPEAIQAELIPAPQPVQAEFRLPADFLRSRSRSRSPVRRQSETIFSQQLKEIQKSITHLTQQGVRQAPAFIPEDVRFKSRSNERQFRINEKIIYDLERSVSSLASGDLEPGLEASQKALDQLHSRQKDIKFADSASWEAVDLAHDFEKCDSKDFQRIQAAQLIIDRNRHNQGPRGGQNFRGGRQGGPAPQFDQPGFFTRQGPNGFYPRNDQSHSRGNFGPRYNGCWECGDLGHYSRECRNRGTGRPPPYDVSQRVLDPSASLPSK